MPQNTPEKGDLKLLHACVLHALFGAGNGFKRALKRRGRERTGKQEEAGERGVKGDTHPEAASAPHSCCMSRGEGPPSCCMQGLYLSPFGVSLHSSANSFEEGALLL